jgi:hypothetical protein
MYEYALTQSLFVSFQRYPYPTTGIVTALATSWGALPFLLRAPGQLVLPCPDEEAFWIGLVASPAGQQHRLRVLVSTTSGDRINALTGVPVNNPAPADIDDLVAPPQHGIPGIFQGDGRWRAFARHTDATPAAACHEIELSCRPAAPVPHGAGPGRQHSGPGDPSPSGEAGETSSVQVDLVEPEVFQALSGTRVPPLDEANRYGGWRLP